MTYKKKLIEVALPLEAINQASAREKEPFTHQHPRSLHIWWARRPLASCRAVLFASLVDDPSARPDEFPTEEAQEAERQRLFRIIEDLALWENSNNEQVLNAAKQEILRSTGGNPPPVLDPFCGGGSIPLEAQRLGLEAHGSDLNPVAVLITKALIEIPPKFANRPPVHPDDSRAKLDALWPGAKGLAEDIRYYGKWMRDKAEKRIGHLYPKVQLPKEHGGGEATVIAWLWARTVKCPNPACGAEMPLVRSFELSKKKGRRAWVEPVVDKAAKTVRFEVKTGEGVAPAGTRQRGSSTCLFCDTSINDNALRAQAKACGVKNMMLAIVAEGQRGRIYISSEMAHVMEVPDVEADWLVQSLPDNARWFSPPAYGLGTYRDLFTPRQLTALTTFSDLVNEAREKVLADAKTAGLADDDAALADGGLGTRAYADAVATYLGLAISRWSDLSNSIASWNSTNTNVRALFARQAIPMAWDFVEISPFGPIAPPTNFFASTADVLSAHCGGKRIAGHVAQLDAATAVNGAVEPMICTDPPYYDNIGYADLSDFFYIWLRRSLGSVYPQLLSTMLTPKTQELIASPYRFDGSKKRAGEFFERGLGQAFARMHENHNKDYPLTVYYAFKQAESEQNQVAGPVVLASTGWETMLAGLIKAGFLITGTWPIRSERAARTISIGANALASSIVLVCRPRPADAPMTTRRDLLNALKREMPPALKNLQHGNIAPVDLAQASIGPGMAVYSRYGKVVEADGSPMTVRTALELINQVLDEFLTEQEGEFDAATRWALTWFEQFSLKEGPYGTAETLANARNTTVSGLVLAGILEAKAGKARLLKRDEMPGDWNPKTDKRLPIWELTQRLISALQTQGESGAAAILRQVGDLGEVARDLAYRLYNLCERKGWTDEALAYNSLVVAWPEIVKLASQSAPGAVDQSELF